MKKDNEKGELVKMEKETGDDCKPSNRLINFSCDFLLAIF